MTNWFKLIGMVIKKLGKLKEHILELNRKCEKKEKLVQLGQNTIQENKKLELSLNHT